MPMNGLSYQIRPAPGREGEGRPRWAGPPAWLARPAARQRCKQRATAQPLTVKVVQPPLCNAKGGAELQAAAAREVAARWRSGHVHVGG